MLPEYDSVKVCDNGLYIIITYRILPTVWRIFYIHDVLGINLRIYIRLHVTLITLTDFLLIFLSKKVTTVAIEPIH
jgi:hypothetical protein